MESNLEKTRLLRHFYIVSIRSGIAKALVILFLCIAIFGGATYFTYKLFVTPEKRGETGDVRPAAHLAARPEHRGV